MNETDWIEILDDLAHELRTPLTAAKANVELVPKYGPLNEQQLRHTDRALEVLLRMEQMINRMLEYARIKADRPLDITECDLEDLILSTIDMLEPLAARRGISIIDEIDPDIGLIEGDSRRLEQVFVNLLGNAIKYNVDEGEILITVQAQDNSVRVSVRDTGIGITPEDQALIFERFFRAQDTKILRIEGSGLGLSIVRFVVEKHGGKIWVESTPGKGSVFTFELPRKQAKIDPDEMREGEHKYANDDLPPPHSLRLLVQETLDGVNDDTQEAPRAHRLDDEDALSSG
ncbi:MAG: HAMP domain-containing sensor histidine kinase [Aggregatilineales bacterium]